MNAELRKQAAELLRNAASALRSLQKKAAQSPSGPVINLTKLRSLLHAGTK
jgi:hypothetical protein